MSATRGGRNPFSTRFVRPGAIPFVYPTGHSAAGTVQRLEALAWRGQIVGPHGAGKSTLVASLVEPLRRAGRPARVFALRDGQRRMPAEWVEQARAAAARAIVVDGYEQLSRTSRWRLKARCRREQWGLLITAHHDVGFPTLARIVGGKVPQDRVIDGVDQTDFFLGSQETSNREGVIVYMGNDIFGVKWRNWKVNFKELNSVFSEIVEYGVPRVYNLLTDPQERQNVLFPHTCVPKAALGQLGEHAASLKAHPPIKPGTLDPYQPK
jgi:hypothetical protein